MILIGRTGLRGEPIRRLDWRIGTCKTGAVSANQNVQNPREVSLKGMKAVVLLSLCLFSQSFAFIPSIVRGERGLTFKPRELRIHRPSYSPTKLRAKYDAQFLNEMLPAGTVVADKIAQLEAENMPLAKYAVSFFSCF